MLPLVLLIAVVNCQVFPSIQIPPIQVPASPFPPSSGSNCCDDRTITAEGEAKLQAQPDQATINAEVKGSGKTVQDAVSSLTSKITNIISVLKANNLSEDNYETSNFNVYPNQTWNNGVSTVLGQIASQTIAINIPSITPDGAKIGKLVDQLATINGITLNGLSFDLRNKTTVYRQAREAAFQNAKSKAKDYAEALSLQLGQAITVKDTFSTAPVVTQGGASNSMFKLAADVAPTTVNVGTIPIEYNV